MTLNQNETFKRNKRPGTCMTSRSQLTAFSNEKVYVFQRSSLEQQLRKTARLSLMLTIKMFVRDQSILTVKTFAALSFLFLQIGNSTSVAVLHYCANENFTLHPQALSGRDHVTTQSPGQQRQLWILGSLSKTLRGSIGRTYEPFWPCNQLQADVALGRQDSVSFILVFAIFYTVDLFLWCTIYYEKDPVSLPQLNRTFP